MPIFDRLFKSQPRGKAGTGVRAVPVIPAKCPTCGKAGDLHFDAEKHDASGMFELDSKTHLRTLECPHCTAGMLLCIRDGRLTGIEPFEDDPPSDVLAAVARTRAKLGM